jgi:hypothetical protein
MGNKLEEATLAKARRSPVARAALPEARPLGSSDNTSSIANQQTTIKSSSSQLLQRTAVGMLRQRLQGMYSAPSHHSCPASQE